MKKTYSTPVVTSNDVARDTQTGVLRKVPAEILNKTSPTHGLGFGL